MKIVFFDTKPYDVKKFNEMNDKYGFDFTYYEDRLTMENIELAKGFDTVCIFVRDQLTEVLVNKLVEYGVKMIALRCAGYNNVDFKAAQGRIKVVHVPAYSPYAIAEMAVTLMLTLNRQIHKAYNRTRNLDFSLNGLLGFDMNGKTVGFIGTGKIAKIAMKILTGFGCKILAYDIYPDEKYAAELGFRYTSLDEIYKESDIISLHTPLTEDTKFMINKESIYKMKTGVMIINTARGKLINTQDLIEGLKTNIIGAAGLDVYENEDDYFYEDHSENGIPDDTLTRLLSFPNVVVTSHQAFFTDNALDNIATATLDSCKQLDENQPLTNELALIDNTIKYAIQK